MDLEQARIFLEKITNKKITNRELASALGMLESGVSRKITSRTKLKQKQIYALEKFYCIRFPTGLSDEDLQNKPCRLELMEEVIVSVENYFNKTKFSMPPAKKARLITTIYSMAVYNAAEINDSLIENLFRLMN